MRTPAAWADAVLALVSALWLFSPGPAQSLGAAVPFTGALLAVWALLRTAALALPGRTAGWASSSSWPVQTVRAVVTALWLTVQLVPWALEGDRPSWFAALPAPAWFFLVQAAGLQVWAAASLLRTLSFQDPLSRPALWSLERLSRIRAKLLGAFLALVVALVVTLSGVLLSRYEASLSRSLADGARLQGQQAAAVYKAALGEGSSIVLFEFLNAQNKINAGAQVPYRSFRFYTDLASRYRLDAPGTAQPPTLSVEVASDRPDAVRPALPPLTGAEVTALLAAREGPGLPDAAAGTVRIAAPITVADFEKTAGGAKVRHDRLLGLAVLTFAEDDVRAPFFLARTAVLLLTAAFLYLAVLLVFLLGTLIVTPLLRLRSEVRTVSDTLETMVDGRRRASAEHLVFSPRVRTRDEIHHLSGEISRMVSVIRGMLPYVSASTLRQSGGTAVSETRRLTFLFTDIRGFTSLCEGLPPDQVVSLLNRYLDLETEIILSNGGDVDKFVGDEVMAFFSGDDQELQACRAALQIRRAMHEEKDRRKDSGLPSVEVGIGIHGGEVVFGPVGARDRRDFTSIGDPVNLAARLEGANKAYRSKSLVSGTVRDRVADQFLFREIDSVAVQGKNDAVRVYELLAEASAVTDKTAALAREFERGLAAYRGRRWAEAAEVFAKLWERYQDGPAEVFLLRARRHLAVPPADDWDGVHRLDQK